MTYWPEDPYGDMAPMLRASIEAAKLRHPSGQMKGFSVDIEPIVDEVPSYRSVPNSLTAADRCDSCNAAAVYRVAKPPSEGERKFDAALLFCLHHWRKHFPNMSADGWIVAGANAELAAAMGQEGA